MNSNLRNDRKVIKFTSAYLTRFTATSSATAVNVDPINSSSLFGPSVVNMANLHQEFRCVGISLMMFPFGTDTASNGSTLCAVGYAPAVTATSPGSYADISQLSDVAVQVSGNKSPVKLVLSRKLLLSLIRNKWMHCDSTPDPDTSIQGRLHYIFGGTDSTTATVTWLVQSSWEFRGPVPFGEFLNRERKNERPVDVPDDKDLLPRPSSEAPLGDGVLVAAEITDYASRCGDEELRGRSGSTFLYSRAHGPSRSSKGISEPLTPAVASAPSAAALARR